MGLFTRKLKTPVSALVAIACACLFTSSCAEMTGGKSSPKDWLGAIKAGQEAQAAGDGAAAIDNYERAAHMAEQQYGGQSPQVGTCLGYLCPLYRDGQDWLKARDAYKRLLVIKMKYEPKSKDTIEFKQEYQVVQQKVRDYRLDPGGGAAQAKGSRASGGRRRHR